MSIGIKIFYLTIISAALMSVSLFAYATDIYADMTLASVMTEFGVYGPENQKNGPKADDFRLDETS